MVSGATDVRRRMAMWSGLVVAAGLLAAGGAARAQCDCDDDSSAIALPWQADRGDPDVGRRRNEPWDGPDGFYERLQDRVMRSGRR